MIWFVCRSPYDGVLGKHVRRLPDPSVLAWFRRAWDESAPDPRAWLKGELGVDVYGLHALFGAPKPETTRELRKLVREHLYVEDGTVVDEHSVRVSTDDDEVPLAYFFLDQHLVGDRPARLAYLLHEQWPLPAATTSAGGDEPVTTIALSHLGDIDWDTQGTVVRLPGVRVPSLAAWLRTTEADEQWPGELTLLRACIGPDNDLAAALDRMSRWGAWNRETQYLELDGLDGDHAEAHRLVGTVLAGTAGHEVVPGPLGERRPGLGRAEVAGHLAQAVFHLGDEIGHQQLFIFDDVWAGDHRHLAKSLRRWFAKPWDPIR